MPRLLILIVALSLSGCFGNHASNDPLPLNFKADIPTIGFLADSQLQTENVHSNTSILNNRLVDDLLVEVAVRTTAQNELADLGLESMLKELTNSGAEIIFYLGDGLNNGCKDEANRFFSILEKHQSKTPIFMVLGNHDYLASGNSRRIKDRESLCGKDKQYLSKSEISDRIEQLNRQSFSLHSDSIFSGWDYISTKSSGFMSCSQSLRQDSEAKCFYAGVLKSPETSYLLLDTSHYENVGTYGELSGAKGYVGSTQVEWFKGELREGRNSRILLSHYSATSFDGYQSVGLDAIHLPTNINRVGELFNENVKFGNIWIWGHTHSANGTLVVREITGLPDPLTIETYEVGSTTDFGNAGAILLSSNDGVVADTQPMCQLFSKKACANLPDNLKSSHVSEELEGRTLADSVGITKAYQQGPWNLETDRRVRTNIRNLTKNYYDAYDFESPEEMQLCMLRLASASEATGGYFLEGLEGAECIQEEGHK